MLTGRAAQCGVKKRDERMRGQKEKKAWLLRGRDTIEQEELSLSVGQRGKRAEMARTLRGGAKEQEKLGFCEAEQAKEQEELIFAWSGKAKEREWPEL